MSTDQSKRKEIARQWYEAYSARDLDRLDKMAEVVFDRDLILHEPGGSDACRGRDAFLAVVHQVVANHSEIHITLEDYLGDGDKTAVRSTVRMTSAATGKTASFPIQVISRWAGDRIAEAWEIDGTPVEQP